MRELMERAGKAVAEEALRRFPDATSFGAVCGGGANGGDARIALEALRAAGREAAEGLDGDVLLDGLFGTGFHGEPRADATEVIAQLNGASAPVVAVDLPSGVDADTGEVAGAAVRATVTVTLHGPKVGNVVGPGRFHGGELVVRDIGLEPRQTRHSLVTREILELVPPKQPGDTKYSASVLVVGGAPGLTGAARLAAEAAFRADAGYVAVAAPAESLPVLETTLLEAVKRPLEEVFDAVKKAGAVAIGPGLGRDEARRELVRRLLMETELPAVVDADGLHGLEPFERGAPTVLTPHAGELAGLLGVEAAWVDAHRLEAVGRAVERSSAASASSRAPTRSWPPPARACSSAARAPRRWRPQARETSSRARSQPSSPRAWMHAWPPPPARRRARKRPGSAPSAASWPPTSSPRCPTRSMSFEHAL